MVRLDEEGQTAQNRLGRLVALDTATIQGVMQRLIARGLAQSGRDPMDRRAVILSLTDAGRSVLQDAIKHGRQANEDLLAPLTDRERAQLVSLLKRVIG
ncbi:winged helix DNA-binding protein [Acetobacteraceae bacterium H6797]|nr:winged helix DNA-binding protein [Acetobacteraceae bacterium H6797]